MGAVPTDEPIAPSIGYRPGLDGLRALAVAAVILYHGDVSWAKGGFLGVDVFFVLSGFLITSLLLTEHHTTGRIDLIRFWLRRARRLLPALMLVLLGVALYAAVWAHPTELGRIRGDGIASLLYVSNWRFVLDGSSYFQLFQAPSPLAHTWSLAIEEQWYLLWPLALLGLLRIVRNRRRVLAAVCALLAAGSAVLMAAMYVSSDPSRVYYGTDTRAQALLVGAVLAAVTSGTRSRSPGGARWRARTLQAAGLIGAAALAFMVVRVDATSAFLYRGGFMLAAVAALALVAAASVDGPIARVLSLRPLVAIGAISYGLYLWHWPVDVALNSTRTGLHGAALFAVRVVVTAGLAVVSYRLVEMPIRRGGLAAFTSRARASIGPIVAPVAAVLVAALLIVSTTGAISSPSLAALAHAEARTQVAADPTKTRVLMLGDSQMLTLMFFGSADFFASGPQYQDAAVVGCGILDPGMQTAGTCGKRARTWRRRIAAFDPDLSVLLLGAWETLDFTVGGRRFVHGTPEHEHELVLVVRRALRTLTARGGRVALLEVPPFGNPAGVQVYGNERSDPASVAGVNRALQTVAADDPEQVTFVRWADAIAPGGRYATTVAGVDVRPDGVHFATEAGARLATARLVPILRRLAVAAHERRVAAR